MLGAAKEPSPPALPAFLLTLAWEPTIPGGVSGTVAALIRELGHLGWASTLLIQDGSAPVPEPESRFGYPTIRWRVRTVWWRARPLRNAIGFLLWLPAACLAWRRLYRTTKWQIVNPHFPDSGALIWVVLRSLRMWNGKVILSVHGADLRGATEAGGIERSLMKWLLGRADAVVTPSAELRREVEALAPRARGRTWTIPSGVAVHDLEEVRDRNLALPAGLGDRRFILNVATFEPKKAQDVLLDAFAAIGREHPSVDLVMVGRESPWVEAMRRRAADLGISDRVHFLLSRPHGEIPALLKRASIFCLPSRAEGHPLALLEAGAYGLPVIATPVGGIGATIQDGLHGLLVPVGDASALAAALDRLLLDQGLASRLGENLRQRVEWEFSWSRTARQYDQLARRLLSG